MILKKEKNPPSKYLKDVKMVASTNIIKTIEFCHYLPKLSFVSSLRNLWDSEHNYIQNFSVLKKPQNSSLYKF